MAYYAYVASLYELQLTKYTDYSSWVQSGRWGYFIYHRGWPWSSTDTPGQSAKLTIGMLVTSKQKNVAKLLAAIHIFFIRRNNK